MDASDPDPGPQEREMNCRPADGSENCGPVIIVFEGREGAPLLPQAADTAQTVPARRSVSLSLGSPPHPEGRYPSP